MAILSVNASFANVLTLAGEDVVIIDDKNNYGLIRSAVRNAIFSNNCPMGNLEGKVDFVVCFVIGKGGGDYSWVEHNLQPRPLRGIIQLHYQDFLDNFNLGGVGSIVGGGIAHEIGHYWLVPGNARIRIHDNGIDYQIETPTSQDVYHSLNEGHSIPDYPIMARQDCHWSPYINGDNSPMDAVNHSAYVNHYAKGYVSTQCISTTGPTYDVPGVGQTTTSFQYSHLERYIMGDLKNDEIPNPGNLVADVINPDWAYPLDFHSGLYALLENGQQWYHGFYQGPHQIRTMCTDGTQSSSPFLLAESGKNLNLNERVGLRIVQNGPQVKFQIRIYKVNQGASCQYLWNLWNLSKARLQKRAFISGIIAGPTIPYSTYISREIMMMDLASGTQWEFTDPRVGWKTIQTVTGRIMKIGLSTRTLNSSMAHVLTSADLCIWERGSAMVGSVSDVPVFNLDTDIPKQGPCRLTNGCIMVPYAIDGTDAGFCVYDESDITHDAPKFTMLPPTGDFAFGGIVAVERCAMVTWAGGWAKGRTLLGKHETFCFSDFILPWTGDDLDLRTEEPLEGKYKTLFCLVAQKPTDLTETRIQSVDKLRKAWEVYLPLVLKHRGADTAFP